MPAPRFYCPQLAVGSVTLPPEEAHHARTALRLRSGDAVTLFDGAGGQAEARLTTVSKQQICAEVGPIARLPFEHPVQLTLAVALPRAPRQPFLFEKCTELGVAAFWPVLCERSVVRPRAGSADRWMRIAIEAAKQSGRAWVPRIESPQPYKNAIVRAAEFDAALVLDLGDAAPPAPEVLARCAGCRTMVACIGPEGGLTADEVEAAVSAGAQTVRLGRTILRVETAAAAVASIVSAWSVAPTTK